MFSGVGPKVIDMPIPSVKKGFVLIQSLYSAISPGTELALGVFGKASMLGKARLRPDVLKALLRKFRNDGIQSAAHVVQANKHNGIALGYSNVGTVVAIGEGVSRFRIGDRVVSNGPHGEYVSVPQTLCAKVPDSVADRDAAIAVLASIGMNAVRLIAPSVGELAVVVGLGPIGMFSAQILTSSGCRVIGIELNEHRRTVAEKMGIEAIDGSNREQVLKLISKETDGNGADSVLIATNSGSGGVVSLAANMSRKKGRIVLVGTAELTLSRRDFYEKELAFSVASSYGPGRYDSSYESGLVDYPLPFVRWTAQRNFEACLQMLKLRQIQVEPMISLTSPVAEAPSAYQALSDDASLILALLEYPGADARQAPKTEVHLHSEEKRARATRPTSIPRVGVIGAGNFSRSSLLPNLSRKKVNFVSLASEGGFNAALLGRRFGFESVTSDANNLLDRDDIDAVFISTRHGSHAELTLRALDNDKSVFVEKPLALSHKDLERISDSYKRARNRNPRVTLTVGFNRRFSSHTRRLMSFFRDEKLPRVISVHINAGSFDPTHWIHDSSIGGGRLLGEAVHFLDLMRHISQSRVKNYHISSVTGASSDSFIVTLEFYSGTIGSLTYSADDAPAIHKERIVVASAGSTFSIDNFRRHRITGFSSLSGPLSWRQDKGHSRIISEFLQSLERGDPPPIPVDEIFEVNALALDLSAISNRVHS